MDRSLKIILFITIGILLINFIVSFLGNSRISGIKKDLENARRSTDSALNQIMFSQSKLSEIRMDIDTFRTSISEVKRTAGSIDSTKTEHENKDNARMASLKKSIGDLKPSLQPISLPEIDVIPLEK